MHENDDPYPVEQLAQAASKLRSPTATKGSLFLCLAFGQNIPLYAMPADSTSNSTHLVYVGT